MSKHHMRTGGIEKVHSHHAANNSHHRKANEKSLKTQSEGYSDPESFEHMHEMTGAVHDGEFMKKGGMC